MKQCSCERTNEYEISSKNDESTCLHTKVTSNVSIFESIEKKSRMDHTAYSTI